LNYLPDYPLAPPPGHGDIYIRIPRGDLFNAIIVFFSAQYYAADRYVHFYFAGIIEIRKVQSKNAVHVIDKGPLASRQTRLKKNPL